MRQTIGDRKIEIEKILEESGFDLTIPRMKMLVYEHQEICRFQRSLKKTFDKEMIPSHAIEALLESVVSTLFVLNHKNVIQSVGGFSLKGKSEFIGKAAEDVFPDRESFIIASTEARKINQTITIENILSFDGVLKHGTIVPLKNNWLLCFTTLYNNREQRYSVSSQDDDKCFVVVNGTDARYCERNGNETEEVHSPQKAEEGGKNE